MKTDNLLFIPLEVGNEKKILNLEIVLDIKRNAILCL